MLWLVKVGALFFYKCRLLILSLFSWLLLSLSMVIVDLSLLKTFLIYAFFYLTNLFFDALKNGLHRA